MTRYVVVNADDFGMTRGTSAAIQRAHLEGVVTSASVVTTTDHYRHGLEISRRHCPDLGLGLHFTLSAGSPLSGAERVPLLSDTSGRFRWRFTSLWGALLGRHRSRLLDQIEIEIEAQIERLLADDVMPDHINSERHIHQLPGLFERLASVAKRHRIPFVRLGRDVGWSGARPPLSGFPKYLLLSALSARNRKRMAGLGSCDRFVSYLYTGRTDLVLTEALARAPSGSSTEIMVHPGLPEDRAPLGLGNRELERYLQHGDRKLELDACIAARDTRSSVSLVTFRELATHLGDHADPPS